MADAFGCAYRLVRQFLLAIAFSRLSFSDACLTFDVLVVGGTEALIFLMFD
jgi:hypothetical protein